MMEKQKTARPRKGTRSAGRAAHKLAGKKRRTPVAALQRRTKGPRPPAAEPRFPVVGIGASAGGLEALCELFRGLPADTGMAYIVVTHQHPGHTSLLPELLGKETKLPVVQAKDSALVEPDHVYVAPPGAYLAIMDSTLQLMEVPAKEMPPLPIDFFFRSLAQDRKERAICIVLSGTGSDGTLGLKAIKGEGGMAMVQDVGSARYAGMPTSAIGTSIADYVLPPSAMPDRLVAYVNGMDLVRPLPGPVEVPQKMERPLQKIFVLLRSRLGHDFSSYKLSTLRRRIERRMNVHQISRPELYVRFLQENPLEINVLFKELLISVTSFFRDPEAFAALASSVLPELIGSRPDDYPIRAWVPGCSTGEEAYSIAIVMRECLEKLNKHHGVQIFATDLDAEAIEAARLGRYPAGIVGDVSPRRLERFFVKEGPVYRIRKEIREMVVFAPQNVIKDPPFTKLDMLSCRNLLIYLNADLQKRLLPIFHYALRPHGILLLGPSETVGDSSALFETVDKKWKIYRRRETAGGSEPPDMPAEPPSRNAGQAAIEPPVRSLRKDRIPMVVEKLLLSRFAPPGVVVDPHGDIVYIHGRTGSFLEPGSGQPRLNIFDMAREGLKTFLASAVRSAVSQDKEAVQERVRVRANGGYDYVNIAVSPIKDPEPVRGLLLVTFTQAPPLFKEESGRKKSAPAGAAPRETDLERDLQFAKESLRTTVEELDTSNEELKSTNEELQSTNEEMQSANEELETSKEELQSLNEELTTVNAELQKKVEELSQTNDDMQNLLNGTEIATIFLDNDLKIKRYTDKAINLVKLIPTDIGRPVSDLVLNIEYDGFERDAREVLETLIFKEAEVYTKDNACYQMRIMPYRTASNVIDGLVVTFVDIGRVKLAETAGREARELFESIFSSMREPMIVLDEKFRIVQANASWCGLFHVSAKLAEGKSVFEFMGESWNAPETREWLANTLSGDAPIKNLDLSIQVPLADRQPFHVSARRVDGGGKGRPARVLLLMEKAGGEVSNGRS
ncbi:MAG TPA: chemotaxis protein CheB [Chitinivibrionales bacterium]|nr:chemotaxis protein CheB [Chitinivibrionales bacterium]